MKKGFRGARRGGVGAKMRLITYGVNCNIVDKWGFDDSIDASMSTSNNTISISELRQDATNLINLAISGQNPLIVMQRSKPKAVLVDYLYFQALEEAIMDLSDSQEAERAKLEPTESFDKFFEKRFGTKVK